MTQNKCPKCGAGPSGWPNGYLCGTIFDASGSIHRTATCQGFADLREPIDQELESLRFRVQELEKRMKRLVEAGDIIESTIGCGCGHDGPCMQCRSASEAWTKAKEETP